MNALAKSLALVVAFAASSAFAQTDSHADHHPGDAAAQAAPARPNDAPQANQGCPMMNGQMMMNGQAMGAHMQNGRMVDKDGKTIMGGMMGPNGMMCMPQASANTESGKVAPKAAK